MRLDERHKLRLSLIKLKKYNSIPDASTLPMKLYINYIFMRLFSRHRCTDIRAGAHKASLPFGHSDRIWYASSCVSHKATFNRIVCEFGRVCRYCCLDFSLILQEYGQVRIR